MSNERSPRGLCSTTMGTSGMGCILSTTMWLSSDNSNQSVVKDIEIDASPEEVWDALVDEDAREEWLDEPGREIHVETADAPRRLVWWWWEGEEPATRVEFVVV